MTGGELARVSPIPLEDAPFNKRPSERFWAPVCVMLLHFSIVGDVVWHQRRMVTELSWHNIVAWSLVVATVLCYLCASCMDPGYLRPPPPRGSLPRPVVVGVESRELQVLTDAAGDTADSEAGDLEEASTAATEDSSSATLPDFDVPVEGQPGVVRQSGHKLRFCSRCGMFQPLRTKHCRDCNWCVRTHDHHCPWVGTCVGEYNRVFFFWFLFFQVLELAWFLLEGSSALFRRAGRRGSEPEGNNALLCIGLLLIILFAIMVSCLLCFHCYLASVNVTTWENITWHKISYLMKLDPDSGSPFSRGLLWNLKVYCCVARVCPTFLRRLCSCGVPDPSWAPGGWCVWELGDPDVPCILSNDYYSCC